MAIRVLLADDSDMMLSAMQKTLREEPSIKIVGAASSFAATMQMIGSYKPEVLLLDLHLPESRNFPPGFVKSQLVSVPHTLAVSFANDKDAHTLAESYGAEALLDKMNLYNELIPAIKNLFPPEGRSRICEAPSGAFDCK
jgi:DNA-binding NarL/FixJ family response regulator